VKINDNHKDLESKVATHQKDFSNKLADQKEALKKEMQTLNKKVLEKFPPLEKLVNGNRQTCQAEFKELSQLGPQLNKLNDKITEVKKQVKDLEYEMPEKLNRQEILKFETLVKTLPTFSQFKKMQQESKDQFESIINSFQQFVDDNETDKQIFRSYEEQICLKASKSQIFELSETMQHIKSEIMMRLKEVDKAQAEVLFSQ
jgi:phage shock protein A